jgi:hypothetical protein
MLDDVDPYVFHPQITEYVDVYDVYGHLDFDPGYVCTYHTPHTVCSYTAYSYTIHHTPYTIHHTPYTTHHTPHTTRVCLHILIHCILIHCILIHYVFIHYMLIHYILIHCILIHYMLIHYILMHCPAGSARTVRTTRNHGPCIDTLRRSWVTSAQY